MEIEATLIKVLKAAAGRIVQPADEATAGNWRGALAKLIVKQLEEMPPEEAQVFVEGLESLGNESFAVFGYPFYALPGSQQDEMLSRVEMEANRTCWAHSSSQFIERLVKLTDEAARRLESGEEVDLGEDEEPEETEEGV